MMELNEIYDELKQHRVEDLSQVNFWLHNYIHRAMQERYGERLRVLWRMIEDRLGDMLPGSDITCGRDAENVLLRSTAIFLIFNEWIPGITYKVIGENLGLDKSGVSKAYRRTLAYKGTLGKKGTSIQRYMDILRAAYIDATANEL